MIANVASIAAIQPAITSNLHFFIVSSDFKKVQPGRLITLGHFAAAKKYNPNTVFMSLKKGGAS